MFASLCEVSRSFPLATHLLRVPLYLWDTTSLLRVYRVSLYLWDTSAFLMLVWSLIIRDVYTLHFLSGCAFMQVYWLCGCVWRIPHVSCDLFSRLTMLWRITGFWFCLRCFCYGLLSVWYHFLILFTYSILYCLLRTGNCMLEVLLEALFVFVYISACGRESWWK